ncbi:MAG: gliding motility-associated C-terminal domain-containing protein [Saprospiraceae bacterium]
MRKIFTILIFIISGQLSLVVAQCPFLPLDSLSLICDQALFLCGSELDGYSSTLVEDNTAGIQPLPGCPNQGEIDNIVWFSFVADNSNLELELSFSGCHSGNAGVGLQAGIYSSCDFSGEKVACKTVYSQINLDLIADPALVIPGEIYYLYIDGYGGAICDYTINVINGVCTEAPIVNDNCDNNCKVTNTYGDSLACVGITETYVLSTLLEQITIASQNSCHQYSNIDIEPIACIEWEILPNSGTEFTISSDNPQVIDSLSERPKLTVTWHEPGTYTIRPIITYNPKFSTCGLSCTCALDDAFIVTVSPTNLIILPDVILCPGDCHEFCDVTYCSDAEITCYDRANCEVEIQNIISKPIEFEDIGDFYICDGVCFEFNGVDYCTENVFSVPDEIICNKSYLFELIDLELIPTLIQKDSLIDCNNSEAIIDAEWATNYSENIAAYWISETGDTVSYNQSYTASTGGVYTLHLVPEDRELCVVTLEHIIVQDDDIPIIDIMPPTLDCNNTSATILASTTAAIASVNWTGPNGYMSTDLSPVVSDSGVYNISGVGANGCLFAKEVIVNGDFEIPTLEINYTNFDCYEEIKSADFITNADLSNIEWVSPDGSVSASEILYLESIGTYQLTITAQNGCTSEKQFTVSDFVYNPSLNLNLDDIWTCNSALMPIDISQNIDNPTLDYSWSSTDGIFELDGNNIIVSSTGTYILTTYDNITNCIGYDTINIIDDPIPFLDFEIITSKPSCNGELDAKIESIDYSGGTGPYTLLYDGVNYEHKDSILLKTGDQKIHIIDAYGCIVNKQFYVEDKLGIEIITNPSVKASYKTKHEFEVDYNVADDQVLNINWYDETGQFLGEGKSLEIYIDTDQILLVELEDLNGCIASATITVMIDYEVEIHYPNVFSPNGDGQNDLFMLFNSGNPETMYALQIYDRAGELVFMQSGLLFNEMTNGWDGTFNGSPVIPGVYVFMVNYTLGNGEEKVLSGSITVVR